MLEFAPRNQPGIYFVCKPSNQKVIRVPDHWTLSIFRRVKWIDLQETQPDELHVSSFRIFVLPKWPLQQVTLVTHASLRWDRNDVISKLWAIASQKVALKWTNFQQKHELVAWAQSVR